MAINMKIIKDSLDSPSFLRNQKAGLSIMNPLITDFVDFAGFVVLILSATTTSFNGLRFHVISFHAFASTIAAVFPVSFVVFWSVCLVLDLLDSEIVQLFLC